MEQVSSTGGIAFWARDAFDEPPLERIADVGKDDWDGSGPLQQGQSHRQGGRNGNVGGETHKIVGMRAHPIEVILSIANVETHTAPLDPSQLRKHLPNSVQSL